MRQAILTLVAAVFLAPAASSIAQDQAQPSRKPGWWEMQVAIMGPTPEPIRQTVHMCTDATSDTKQSPFGVNMSGGGCQPMKVARAGSGWTIAGACDTGQMKIIANAVATGDLNDRYHVDIDTRMDPPPTPQAAQVKVAIDSHWLGQCPAGMKPGDTDRAAGPGAAPPAGN
jgi:hypothetical protein